MFLYEGRRKLEYRRREKNAKGRGCEEDRQGGVVRPAPTGSLPVIPLSGAAVSAARTQERLTRPSHFHETPVAAAPPVSMTGASDHACQSVYEAAL
ncbi:hypothetical protein MTO96_021006 [Rhipicephalus appendiculatus]